MNTNDRRHIDNVSGTLFHHDRSTSMDEVECRFQVYVEHSIPLSFAHTHHQTVFRDTGIVYQDVDTAEVFLYLCHYIMCIFKVSCVRSITFCFNT